MDAKQNKTNRKKKSKLFDDTDDGIKNSSEVVQMHS